MWPIRSILVATDLSEPSERVLELAAALARDRGARLVVLHMAEPPPFVRPGEMARVLQQAGGYRQELEDRLRRFRPAGLEGRIDYRVEEGTAADAILRLAEVTPCDLVVLGTHGRTGLGRLLLGSVAEQVLRRAVCPVLTVRLAAQSPPPAER
jgi:universal stress protein A